MELHAHTRTISDILSLQKKYLVPRFQREYSWTEDQVLELWEDIQNGIHVDGSVFTHEEHFIGSIVLSGDYKYSALKIVDGQQRLTTITIILSAICEIFRELKEDKLAESVFDNYIQGKDDNGDPYFKLEHDIPKLFLQSNIQNISKIKSATSNKEDERFNKAYNTIKKQLTTNSLKEKFNYGREIKDNAKHLNIIKALRDQTIRYLKAILITVTDEDDAYTIFETLNARGTDLTSIDLIKNKLFKELKTNTPVDQVNITWNSICNNISKIDKNNGFSDFLHHWWGYRYAYNITRESLYKNFKYLWSKGEIDAHTFINELAVDSEIYLIISNPYHDQYRKPEYIKLYQSLRTIKDLKLSQARPLMLALYKLKEKKMLKLSDLENCVNYIEKLHFAHNIIGSKQSSALSTHYSEVLNQLRESTPSDNILEFIENFRIQTKEHIPKKEEFLDKILELECHKTEDKKAIKYIFITIERSRLNTDLNFDSITLEHIRSRNNNIIPENERIGNLLPLSHDLNQKAENFKLKGKIKIYKQSYLTLPQRFASSNPDQWSDSDIKKRSKKIAEEFFSLFMNSIKQPLIK